VEKWNAGKRQDNDSFDMGSFSNAYLSEKGDGNKSACEKMR